MTKMIQLSGVPEDVHRALEMRAAEAGLSLSDYLIREFERMTAPPTQQEFLKRLRSRPIRHLNPTPTEMLREERDKPREIDFQAQHREAIEGHNRFIDENGIWSERLRSW